MVLARCAAVVLCTLAAGACGGSNEGDASSDEARSVLEDLGSLGKGEIVIKAKSSGAFGPYRFKRGGYLFRFRRDSPGGRLTVRLESEPNSRRQPFQDLVDTTDVSGRHTVNVSGKLYVSVANTGGSYELHFTPRR